MTLKSITTDLGLNLTEFIMTMNKPVTKETNKQLENLINSTVLYFGLHKIQTMNFLARAVQDISNCGITRKVTLLKDIDMFCSKIYKYVQHHLT